MNAIFGTSTALMTAIIVSFFATYAKAETVGKPLDLLAFTKVDYSKSGVTKSGGCFVKLRPSPTKSHDLDAAWAEACPKKK